MTPKTMEEWQAWQRGLGVPIIHAWNGGGAPLSGLVEYIASEKARGRGLVAMFALPTDSAAYENLDGVFAQLLFVEPDPYPELVDPATITFTLEDALARAKQQQHYGHSVSATEPVTDIQATLMTLPEVDAFIDHDIPPGRPGTVPGALVILVLFRGLFVVHGPGGITIPHTFSYQVCDTRTGHIFRSGAGTKDIALPQW